MKLFTVGVWEEESGYVTIRAKSKKAAIEEVGRRLNEQGIDDFNGKGEKIEITHRDTGLL